MYNKDTIVCSRGDSMRLDSPQSIFNMGDTSIRVKQLVEVNKLILKHVKEYMDNAFTWQRNTSLQEDFYKSFIDEIVRLEKDDGLELFVDFKRAKNYKVNPNRLGLRGRTLTNGLVKTGLITSNRKISNVGRAYFNNNLAEPDSIEKILGLSEDNLVYLRQFLKLRIYSSESDNYFYNFRFAVLFLSKYDNVPQQDFLKIIESIKPEQSEEELLSIISEYYETSKNNETFEDFYKRTFVNTLRSNEELEAVKSMFDKQDLSDDNFVKHFNNRDSSKTPLLYKEFVLLLLNFIENPNASLLANIQKLSKDERIKKAFGEGRIPFKLKPKMSVIEFLQENNENPLLSGDGYQIYLQFVFSKHNDLIREYSDMCRRTFQATGLVSFDNGLVNLNNKWVILPLLKLLDKDFNLTGHENYDDYELNEDSVWFANKTTKEILNISESNIQTLYTIIGQQFGTSDFSKINNLIVRKRELEYRDFIETHFPVEKVIEILEYIKVRDDDKVFDLVTENATVPTIFEYILTIVWFYISKHKSFCLHQIFQVSLDGNKLPLTHRGGGAGDIEIVTEDYSLLIEATLMDLSSQKRGEMEPVIRHSINFALENDKSQTIFIANELDDNVINVFRATQFIQFNGTLKTGVVNGLKIFGLTTDELILILQKGINDIDLLNTITSYSSTIPIAIENNWRQEILDDIFSK